MLTLYRRHKPNCKLYLKGRDATNCLCPIWTDGTIHSHRIRKSLNTKDWRIAQDRIDLLNSGREEVSKDDEKPTLALVINNYLTDCQSRNVSEVSISSYTATLYKLSKWFQEYKPNRLIYELSVTDLDKYRALRAPTISINTQRKELIIMRAFFAWAADRGLIESNPAKKIKMPTGPKSPTLPYTDEESSRIIAACQSPYERALVLTLLYSGLRISDVITLEKTRLKEDGRLLLRQEKTGEFVYVKLHQDAIGALKTLNTESNYFFWDGKMLAASAINEARQTLQLTGARAGVAGVRPHRFRDTFAVTLLLAGVDIRTVSLLLGHTSIQTTEQHYAPFVRAMQKRLDEAVARLQFGGPCDSNASSCEKAA